MRRKDEDFNLLHRYLQKSHPHILIPPVTAFKQGKKYEPVFLKKRARILEKFLRCLMRSEELKSDHVLLQFLSCTDKKEYDTVMKAVEKATAIVSVRELVT